MTTGSSEVPGDAAPAAAAGAWDARLRAADCTDEDRARFAAWRDADPAHEEAFELLQTIVASLSHDRARADVRSLRADALRVVSKRQSRRRLWWVGIAAGVVAVATGAALWDTPIGSRLSAPMSELAARLRGSDSFSTGLGQRSTFVLEDGSSVELDAESRIRVRFSRSRRDIELLQGQALFSVARNSERPFVVRAGNRQITALGTQFDVRLDSHIVQVTLLEGKVRIQPDAPTGTPEIITLTPGKQLTARLAPEEDSRRKSAAGTSTIRDIDVAKVTGWRDGRIFLEDLRLADAVEEMNKHSIVQIHIGDESLAQLRVNGMFRAGEQQAFVTALEVYFPIAAEHRGEHEIVLTSRP